MMKDVQARIGLGRKYTLGVRVRLGLRRSHPAGHLVCQPVNRRRVSRGGGGDPDVAGEAGKDCRREALRGIHSDATGQQDSVEVPWGRVGVRED